MAALSTRIPSYAIRVCSNHHEPSFSLLSFSPHKNWMRKYRKGHTPSLVLTAGRASQGIHRLHGIQYHRSGGWRVLREMFGTIPQRHNSVWLTLPSFQKMDRLTSCPPGTSRAFHETWLPSSGALVDEPIHHPGDGEVLPPADDGRRGGPVLKT